MTFDESTLQVVAPGATSNAHFHVQEDNKNYEN